MDHTRSATPTLTVPGLIEAQLATSPTAPLVTFYDDATGERGELSGITLANWMAKTANLLVDGCGLDRGAVVAVRLPPHWQTAAILLGSWAAGLRVNLSGTPAADVYFVAADRLADAFTAAYAPQEVFATALAPMAAPVRPAPPPGVTDYVLEVRAHGDHFRPARPVDAQTPALADGTTHAALLDLAAPRASSLGDAGRVLVDGDAYPDPVDWLLAPLRTGASIVLCRHTTPARRQHLGELERATTVLS
jgi:uncharacterized protein (TIGR03089 family)